MSEKYYKGIKICCENCCNDVCKRGGRCLLKGMVTSQLLWMPSDDAYEARIDELTKVVRRTSIACSASDFYHAKQHARALLRGESEEGK